MRVRWSATLLAVLAFSIPGYAVDLTKVERRIRVEPIYETNSPRYCLLVFGPKAEKRVWLVRDGKTMYVDRNGNGILNEPGERIQPKYATGSSVSHYVNQILPRKAGRFTNDLRLYSYSDGVRMRFYGKQLQYVGFVKAAKTKFSSSPAEAPIVHFNGPLTLGRYAGKVTLRPNPAGKSYRTTSLRLMVGTKGLGEGTFASLHCRCRSNKGDLVATFRYPSKSPGVKLLVEKVTLKTYG